MRSIKVSERAYTAIRAMAESGRWTLAVAVDMALFPEERPGTVNVTPRRPPEGPRVVRDREHDQSRDQTDQPAGAPLDPNEFVRSSVPKSDTMDGLDVGAYAGIVRLADGMRARLVSGDPTPAGWNRVAEPPLSPEWWSFGRWPDVPVVSQGHASRAAVKALVSAIPGLTTAAQLTKRRGSVAVAPPGESLESTDGVGDDPGEI
jgi:hypothetical protein